MPKQYAVGEALQLDNLNISLKTEKGSSQRLNGWAECRNRGFAASVENGHRFTAKEAGKQTITISVGDHQQTFQVEVKDYASQIPAKVELYDSAKDTLLKTITVEDREWKKDKGCVTKTGLNCRIHTKLGMWLHSKSKYITEKMRLSKTKSTK